MKRFSPIWASTEIVASARISDHVPTHSIVSAADAKVGAAGWALDPAGVGAFYL
jgi:hypothetical protein